MTVETMLTVDPKRPFVMTMTAWLDDPQRGFAVRIPKQYIEHHMPMRREVDEFSRIILGHDSATYDVTFTDEVVEISYEQFRMAAELFGFKWPRLRRAQ